jgi:hypothetical protein
MGYLSSGKIQGFFLDMIGLEGALFNRWKLEGNEGLKAHSKEGRIGNALPLMVEGSKARSNGGRIGNALPLMVKGSKARSKRNKTRARRCARIEVG